MVEQQQAQNIEEKINHQNNWKHDGRLLYQIVGSMWYDWKKVKKDLAIWATWKYISYEEDKEWNRKQNDAIKSKILSGEQFQSNLNQSISKFSWKKQEKIKQIVWDWEFTISRVDAYVSSLPKDKVAILENLSDEKFVWFLHQEMEYSKNVSDKLSKVYGSEVQTATKEQLANIVVLSNIDEKLQRYISENKQFEKHYTESEQQAKDTFLKIERKKLELKIRKDEIHKLRIAPKSVEKRKELEEKENKLQQEIDVFQKNENVILLNKYGGSYEAAKKHMAISLTTRRIRWSKEYKTLDEEKKKEFDTILVDVYRHNEKISPELNDVYFPDMKLEIEQKEREINHVNLSKSFADSQKTVLQNKEFNNYFKDNYINEFVAEEQKDQKYRDNLQKLYPDSKKLIQAYFSGLYNYKNCFDLHWNVINKEIQNLTKEEQILFDNKVKEKLKTVDKEFVWNINNVVKEQSVETCLATLSKCMNIKFDDGTKEDMIKNFDFASHMNDKLVVEFKWNINGKSIDLSYDMINGSVSYQEYLYKDVETNTFKKNDANKKTEMSFVKLAKLNDFVLASKSVDYTAEMWKYEDLDGFNSSVKNQINSQVQKNIDVSGAHQNLEKTMFQDIAMQEVFSFMWYWDNKNLSNIDKIEEPNLYKLYSMIYESISFYSIDEIKSFRQCIALLNLQKSKISDNYNNLNISKDNMDTDVDLNQERVFFDLLMNNSISKSYAKKDTLDNSYLSFFECFIKDDTRPLSVIDLSEMQDYIWKLDKEINKDTDNILQWKRNDVFKKNLWRIRDNYDVLTMEKSF